MAKISLRALAPFAMAIAAYCVVLFSVSLVQVTRSESVVLESVDARLFAAASSLKFLLADDFHDRAVDASSIGLPEELANRRRFNALAASSKFAWVYTLAEKDGKFFFSSPTVTPKEAAERGRWYFYPYEDAAGAFYDSFADGKVRYADYKDEWGSYRTVIVPERSPGGRAYLACADLEISSLAAVKRSQLAFSLIASAALFFAAMPLIMLRRREMVLHNRALSRMNAQLSDSAQNAEIRFRSLFDHSADAVAVLDAEDRVSYVNPAFVQLFGWTRADLEGKIAPIVPEGQGLQAEELAFGVRANRTSYRGVETRRFAKDGSLLTVSISGTPLMDGKGAFTGSLLTIRDLTHQRLLESRISQDEKLRVAGAMAAGAAHDFNNALMIIQGNASLLLMEDGLGPEAAALAQRIEKSVKNASVLTRALLDFAHPESSEKTRLDLGAVASRVVESYAPTRPELKLAYAGPGEECLALANEASIERVLLNLVKNADQATGGVGSVRVSVLREKLDIEAATLLSVAAGGYAVVRVADDGSGMDEETKRRLFEPFFTKKGRGVGSGLGLASSYASVKALGGALAVESELGKGAVFSVYLPEPAFTP